MSKKPVTSATTNPTASPSNIGSGASNQPLPWELKAEIVPQDRPDFTPILTPDDGFGASVAVSDDTLIVGSNAGHGYHDWGGTGWVIVNPPPGPGSA